MDKPGEKRFSEKQFLKLCDYILEELPEILNGFDFKDNHYSSYVYPYDSELTQFVEDLQNRKIFPEIADKLEVKRNLFIELEV